MEWVTSFARQEGRRIVYWTSKESEEFGAAGFDLGDIGFDLAVPMRKRMKSIFQDFRAAKRELRTATSDAARNRARKRAHGLCVRCAEEVGLGQVPTTYGWGKVGAWIRKCEAMTEREYVDWAPGAKKAWGKLVAHNKLDCRALEVLAQLHVSPST